MSNGVGSRIPLLQLWECQKRVIASLGKGNETNPSESSFLTQVEGIVTKINDANLESGYTFVIQIEGNKRHFLVNPNTFIDVVTTEKG